ncbi:MAG: CRISPR-associated helicase Cas3' [Pyrinomonadaceae bacterium]
MEITKFWAKTTDDKTGLLRPNAFHPLVCHLIDVAAVTETMWNNILPKATKRKIAESFNVKYLNEDFNKFGSLVAFVAGLHDLGKCSPPFTLRYTKQQIREIYTNEFSYEKHKQNYGEVKPSDAPHGYVTAVELPKILEGKDFNFPKSLADQISILIGGHHGTFPESFWKTKLKNPKLVGNEKWTEARKLLVLELEKIFPVKHFIFPENAKLDNATMMILAGLVSVADWIGSNAFYFPCVADTEKDFPPEIDLQDYLQNYAKDSRKKAGKALHELGWLNWQQPTNKLKFRKMFSEIKQPRDLQIQAENISQNLESAGIVVVESPTGEGKTEAAIYLADIFNYNLKQNGIYFALPTQATSNQMFGRVKEFLESRFPNGKTHLQLVHGHAAINADFLTILKDEKGAKNIQLENISGDDEKHDDCGSTVEARAWFTGRKKALLAPFGVGTIDQALLTVLQTRHVFVRLFGLAHKTIIIDEVHAYDAYMSTLLERLLMWLAALGSPVILLSATLPKERRNRLLEAYLKGLGVEFATEKVNELKENPKDKYPRIAYATNDKIDVVNLDTSKQNTRTLYLEHLDGFLSDDTNKLEELARKIKDRLPDGGCAAIICNTVKRAQEIFTALNKYFTDENNFSASETVWKPEEIDLLHARFLHKDRMKRVNRALLNFGKDKSKVMIAETIDGKEKLKPHKVERPTRAILVSTQIIEQSLDLDFDLMITELAPIDLILQRAGRLMRHRRKNRPANFNETRPMLWILQPETNSPDFGVNKIIYDEHILLRSWLFSRELDTIKIPTEIEDLIEKVYDTKTTCPSAEYEKVWNASFAEYEKGTNDEIVEAENRWISMPHVPQELYKIVGKRDEQLEEDSLAFFENFRALTRLNADGLSIICLYGSTERAFLDADEENPIDVKDLVLSKNADKETEKRVRENIKQLLFNSISISRKDLILALLKAEETTPPTEWKKCALLKSCVVLWLEEDSSAEIENFSIYLHPKLGLRVVKFKNEKEDNG